MKLAIAVISDPTRGEEALGRLFNALALAAEARSSGDQVDVVFVGTGTRWPAELSRLDHPAHALYESVRPTIKGASRACALVFDASAGVVESGVTQIDDNPLPGTAGLASLRRYLVEGWQTLVF